MRGRIPHDAVEDFLNSADFLLQASLKEIGSYSVLEAMSCGVIPVVSDIATHRAMTDHGRCGVLFPPRDPSALADRVLALDAAEIARLSADAREFFVQHWSYEHIAQVYEAGFASARS
jgi:glycosyltransferase involved in cell wall biosynthesis